MSAELTKARRGAGASGLVLTLIIATTDEHFDAVVAAARASATAHPSRVIVVTNVDDDEARLDARIQVGDGLPGDLVVLRLHGLLQEHADSILLPLLLPDSPTIAWWPNEGPDDLAADPIGQLADRRITDASECRDPQDALLNRARHHTDGDTDLTWTRITRWRALLVAAVDQLEAPVTGAKVVSAPDNAPATLLAAWLSLKLGVDVERTDGDSAGVNEVHLHSEAGDVIIKRPANGTAHYSTPGQPPRKVALRRRPLTDLLTEELERIDTDEVFEATLEHLLTQHGHA
ncbi:MAG: glucose-6-phosphate dehydrogenase assembly protein OpcA [Propionibacterium sp.]|nr:glucose-6-phosphate dehydrogenase assembly protein OpcA [Propionibacterium sp.]